MAYTATARRRPDTTGVAVAYTPMHGVGGELVCRAFEAAGLPTPLVVEQQFAPDPRFPTVQFPNPEEPGAMDLVIALAAERGAALALANDPDADRLGAAIPQPDGSWRRIGGDELGWLLADHILRNPVPDDGELSDRLVITTLVSSSLLEQMAADHGVHFAETFTGFKWIGRKVVDNPRLAIRVRLRAGARLPRRAAPARQGRHHRRGGDGRDRRRGRAPTARRCRPASTRSPPATGAT